MPELEGRLVFVGSPRFMRAAGYFVELDQNPQSAQVVESLGPLVRETRRAPEDEQVESAIESLGLADAFDAESRRRLPAYVVQQENLAYRIELLRAVADLEPVVYGNGWEKLAPEGVELRGAVDYYRDLPAIYRSDAVHLAPTNLQMRAYPNQRVFDAGACGGAVLVDELEGWTELFGDGLDGLVFGNLSDLKEKARELSENRLERRQMGEMLREKVVSEHTIAHRIDKILDVVGREGR